jgi:hypothetical protein
MRVLLGVLYEAWQTIWLRPGHPCLHVIDQGCIAGCSESVVDVDH